MQLEDFNYVCVSQTPSTAYIKKYKLIHALTAIDSIAVRSIHIMSQNMCLQYFKSFLNNQYFIKIYF